MSTRLFCLSEGQPPNGPMGHRRIEAAIRNGLAGRADVEARFAELPDPGPVARGLTRGVPGLRAHDLDLQTLRWHLVHGWRARCVVRGALREAPADAMTVVSHAITFGLRAEMLRVPTLLSVDATVWQVRAMELWRPLRRASRLQLAISLAAERRSFERAARVLAWSSWARRGVEASAPRADVVVHHPGIDVGLFAPARDRPPPGGPLRVLFVGGRFGQKGGDDLLAAAGPRLGQGIELDIVTAEDVSERPGVRVHRLGAGDPRLVELFQQRDLLCLPSHGDAAPWVVLEAMACGIPVIATKVGGIPDMVEEERTGLLVPPQDPRALRAALEHAATDRDRLRAWGRAARGVVERDFDARRQTQRLVEMVRGLAGAGG